MGDLLVMNYELWVDTYAVAIFVLCFRFFLISPKSSISPISPNVVFGDFGGCVVECWLCGGASADKNLWNEM